MDEMKAAQEVKSINPRLSQTGLLPSALVGLLLVAVLVACGASQDERVFDQAGQELHVILAYEGQARYLEEA